MNGDEPDQHSRPRGKNISFKFLSFGRNLHTHNCSKGGGMLELTLDFHKYNFHFFGGFHFRPSMSWGYTMYSQHIGGLKWNQLKEIVEIQHKL